MCGESVEMGSVGVRVTALKYHKVQRRSVLGIGFGYGEGILKCYKVLGK